jgi:hypothetical protein
MPGGVVLSQNLGQREPHAAASAHYLVPQAMRRRMSHHVSGDHTGASTDSHAQLQSFDTQLGGAMDALNAVMVSCTALPASDATAWAAFYSSWQTLHKHAGSALGSWSSWNMATNIILSSQYSDILAQEQAMQSQLAAWQQKAKGFCAGYTPTPLQGSPGPGAAGGGSSGSWFSSLFSTTPDTGGGGGDKTTWATSVKWVAIAAITIGVIWFVAPFLGVALTGVKALGARHGVER